MRLVALGQLALNGSLMILGLGLILKAGDSPFRRLFFCHRPMESVYVKPLRVLKGSKCGNVTVD